MDKETIRKRIEDQIALEKKAHEHVEHLSLTDFVGKNVFEEVLNQITPAHYSDIVVERSIAKQCGYPLCSNKLTMVPKQRFHISVKKKKIYDITERKCFCSNNCFKSSNYIKSQIPSDPLWLRKERVNFLFLDTEKNDSNKEEPITEQSLVHSESDVIKESVDDKFTNLHIFESLSGDQNQACKNQIEIPPGRSHAMVTDLPETQFKTTKNVNIERLCSILDEWCTFDTYVFFKSKANKDETEKWRETIAREEGNITEKKLRSANAFLEENIEWKNETMECKKHVKSLISPPVDSKSQNKIRQRIVLQKLKQSFSEVLPELSISIGDFHPDLFSLIKTFKFTNHNISLKPNEWKLVAITFLHLFACQEASLEGIMDKKKDELKAILNKCGTDQGELETLLRAIIQYAPQKYKSNDIIESKTCEYDNDSLD